MIKSRDRFAKPGIGGLQDEPHPGRPKTVDDAAIISATLKPPPEKLGGTWSRCSLASSPARQSAAAPSTASSSALRSAPSPTAGTTDATQFSWTKDRRRDPAHATRRTTTGSTTSFRTANSACGLLGRADRAVRSWGHSTFVRVMRPELAAHSEMMHLP